MNPSKHAFLARGGRERGNIPVLRFYFWSAFFSLSLSLSPRPFIASARMKTRVLRSRDIVSRLVITEVKRQCRDFTRFPRRNAKRRRCDRAGGKLVPPGWRPEERRYTEPRPISSATSYLRFREFQIPQLLGRARDSRLNPQTPRYQLHILGYPAPRIPTLYRESIVPRIVWPTRYDYNLTESARTPGQARGFSFLSQNA